MTATFETIAAELDAYLGVTGVRDYPFALNGAQFDHRGPVRRVASAVDASLRTISAARDAGANLLLVHHGLYWSGLVPLTGSRRERIAALIAADLAVYSAHLPLDGHPEIGNARLLAREIGLTPTTGFAVVNGFACGVAGEADVPTASLLSAMRTFAGRHGGTAVASAFSNDRRTRRWAICTGAGANATTLDEAATAGIDTLIVGEGPHWTAVDAPERGLVIIYAGHYATETPGIRALGDWVARRFSIPHAPIDAPTGL